MDPPAVILQSSTEGEENTGKWGLGGTSCHGVHPEWSGLGGQDPFLCPITSIPSCAGLEPGLVSLSPCWGGLQLLIVPQQSQIRDRGT